MRRIPRCTHLVFQTFISVDFLEQISDGLARCQNTASDLVKSQRGVQCVRRRVGRIDIYFAADPGETVARGLREEVGIDESRQAASPGPRCHSDSINIDKSF